MMTRFDCCTIGVDVVRPYVASSLLADRGGALPGTPSRPVPLLMYSPTVYFARVVDGVIAKATARCTASRASRPR